MIMFKLKEAHSHIKGGKQYPSIDGTVDFKETKDGVLLTAKIHGLPKSTNRCKGRFFGFHIHEGGSCTGNKEDEFANVSVYIIAPQIGRIRRNSVDLTYEDKIRMYSIENEDFVELVG